MKRTFKHLIALLMAAIMVVGLLPTFAFAEVFSRDNGDEEMPRVGGYVPVEPHGARAVSNAVKNGDMETYYRLTGNHRDTLPSSYDSRNYNYITSVKNQGSYGSCWAHAAMACVEASMIKNGIRVGTGSAATTSLNLSETQHCFFSYSAAYDAEGMLEGDVTNMTDSSGKNGLDCGGNGEMSSYTLMRWTGSASETTSALAYSNASSVANNGLSSQYAYGSNVSHVQNCIWVPSNDIEGVKRAIMEYGAGNISYCASNGYTSYSNTYQCVTSTSASPNHAITVVGWDDSISKSNFKPNTPSGNGGWLCKNSWGTSYFNQGYMYISYEDASVANAGYIYFYVADDVENYDHNYQYDGTINLACYGKGYNSSTEWYEGFANNTKVANVFTAQGSEMLKAVAYCCWDEALDYTVEIYKNPTTGNPSSGTLMSSQTGYLTYSGYYTIVLDTPVLLSAGDTFSVVITQSCETAADDGKYIHTPYDATFNNSSWADWLNFVHANHGNTSYYQEPNGAWTDCPDNGDYRIKAYTDDYENPYTVTATVNSAMYGSVSVTGTVITATPANGYYVESCTLVSGNATWTISGNTINVSPSSDCTIRVNFAPKPSYTVNFVASGTAQGSQTAYLNDPITLPTSVSVDPDGWTFAGWVTAQFDETTDEPAYYAPGASYTVTGNATLYALFTRVDGGGSETVYQLVESAPTSWAGNYVITNNPTNITDLSSAYVLKGVTGSSNGTNAETASNCTAFSSTGIVLDNSALKNVPNDYIIVIDAQGSYYSVKSAATGCYYGMNSSSYLYAYSSYNSSYCAWTPAINTNGVAQLKNNRNGSYPYFSWSTSNSYFWSGSSNNANVLRLWKETVISSDVTYYCTDPSVAQPTEYTVTFKDWDGTVLKTETVAEGGSATAPADPARTGYTFTGWDVSFTNVTSDLIVTAQYQINNYTVTYYVNGVEIHQDTYNYGANVTAYSYTAPVGYTFSGWTETIPATMPAQNLEIHGTTTINTYTVTFVDWNDAVISTQNVEHGGAATAPAAPERTGYNFTGWDTDFSNVTSNLTVKAQYEAIRHTLTINYVYYQNGQAAAEAVTVSLGYEETYSYATPELANYTADTASVEGVMGLEDITVTVTYYSSLNGDVNCDGKVDFEDVTLLSAFTVGSCTLVSQGALNGDINGDGETTSVDISYLYNRLLNSSSN